MFFGKVYTLLVMSGDLKLFILISLPVYQSCVVFTFVKFSGANTFGERTHMNDFLIFADAYKTIYNLVAGK